MEIKWVQIFILWCLFSLISAQTTPAANGIQYFVDRVGGRSCDQVCQEQGLVCVGTNHGIPSNAEPTFKKAGVDCQFDDFDPSRDEWQFNTDPKYGIGGLDNGICRGFENVPKTIFCGTSPDSNFGRLCPCDRNKTTTEAPTTTATPEPTTVETTTQADKPTPSPRPTDGLTVQCSSDSMVAILDLTKFPKLDTNTMTLEDSSCKPSFVNDTHAFIETPLDGCSTTSNTTGDYIHYYNNIKISMKRKNASSSDVITRDLEAFFPFECSFDRSIILSVVSFSPRRKKVYTRVEEYGNFTFTMDIYKTDQYKEVYDPYPAKVDIGQRLFVQVKAESKDSHLVLFAQKCYATPTKKLDDKTSYAFIQKGCGKDTTLRYNYDDQSPMQRFSIESFRFLSVNTDEIFLHCELVVCRKMDNDSVCAKGCENGGKSRRRRALPINLPSQTLTIGPVDFVEKQAAPNVATSPASVSVTTIAAIAGTFGLLVIVLVAAIAIVHRRRQPRSHCRPVLLVQEDN